MTCRRIGGAIVCGGDDPAPMRVPCSVCGRQITQNKNGTVRIHGDKASWPPENCAGSRKPPASEVPS